jgi:homoserine O-acetyltransferase
MIEFNHFSQAALSDEKHESGNGELATKLYQKQCSIQFSSGAELDDVTLSYSIAGNFAGRKMVILGGISAHRHVSRNGEQPGWWDELVGEGKAVNLQRDCVVSMDYIGGAHNSSGATELKEKNKGQPVPVSTRDQARGLVVVLDELGIPKLDFIIGASYGGMVGQVFAALFPGRVKTLICISAAHESVPLALATRHVQREIVNMGGKSGFSREAMILARQLAMVSYRTPEELNRRFEAGNRDKENEKSIISYLQHCGENFAGIFPDESFLTLSNSLDEHSVDPDSVAIPVHLIGVEPDNLVPFSQIADLARKIRGPVYLHKITSIFGHDAFLKEVIRFSKLLISILGEN